MGLRQDSPAGQIADVVTPPTNTTRPNILLIIADDLGLDASPGYGDGIKASMPVLQSLQSEGLTFDNVWAYPLCSPTRAAILTGRHGFRTSVQYHRHQRNVVARCAHIRHRLQQRHHRQMTSVQRCRQSQWVRPVAEASLRRGAKHGDRW